MTCKYCFKRITGFAVTGWRAGDSFCPYSPNGCHKP